MEFIKGFSWSLPKGFSNAVSQCLFEEGDLLYPSTAAYSCSWSEIWNHIPYCIQVRHPKRGQVAKTSTGDVFKSNWISPVTIELFSPGVDNTMISKIIETTQGKLYSTIWHNDISLLTSSTQMRIPDSVQGATKRIGNYDFKNLHQNSEECVFVFPFDGTNDISIQKLNSLSKRFRNTDDVTFASMDFNELNNIDTSDLVPSIELKVLKVKNIQKEKFVEEIKAALYKKTAGAKKEMFRISAHGRVL